jgi:hypothetical protein
VFQVAHLRAKLAAIEDRLCDVHDRCRLEAEECAAAWGDRERVLLDCVHVSEDEVKRARQVNTKPVESQRVKVSEATVQGSLRSSTACSSTDLLLQLMHQHHDARETAAPAALFLLFLHLYCREGGGAGTSGVGACGVGYEREDRGEGRGANDRGTNSMNRFLCKRWQRWVIFF